MLIIQTTIHRRMNSIPTLLTLLDIYRSGEASPQEMIQQQITHIAQGETSLHAVLYLNDAAALESASQAGQRWKDGRARPLEGVPYGIKDTISTCGIPTTFGSSWWQAFAPQQNALVVDRLNSAGAIPLLKTHTTELAIGGPSPEFPQPRNPWNLNRVPGGSSSGSAASVAAGYVPFSLGTDTGGSTRSPASYCGVVGVKPSNNLIPMNGILQLAPTLDCVGVIADAASSLGLLLSVLGAARPLSLAEVHSRYDLGRLTIAVPSNWAFEAVENDVELGVREAIRQLERRGARVSYVVLERAHLAWLAGWTILMVEASSLFEGLPSHVQSGNQSLKRRLSVGQKLTARHYLDAQRARMSLRESFLSIFGWYDVIAVPTTPTTAPLLSHESVVINGEELDLIDLGTRLTMIANVLGSPAISLPCGFDQDGLPIGLQLIGKPHDDARLLRIAAACEDVIKSEM
jgi:aspartyl-tRNA(Asn)/glutamyl-tRNA(Gln) amidotransferase subunit A